MKLKSLVLGSVAAAGLSTGAFAADLSVLTSLDVCDALGISGLTISSDTNCLKISGNVSYAFNYGDYRNVAIPGTPSLGLNSQYNTIGSNWVFGTMDNDGVMDWESIVKWNLTFEASADSEFGTAKAVLTLKEERDLRQWSSNAAGAPVWAGADPNLSFGAGDTGVTIGTARYYAPQISEAYVQIGDSIVLMAGRKGTIAADGQDTPYNFLGLFGTTRTIIENAVSGGNGYERAAMSPGVWVNHDIAGAPLMENDFRLGGDVIQATADLGNGFYVSGGLENLGDTVSAYAGTLVGVVGYKGETVSAHATVLASGILDGVTTIADSIGFHGGVEARFDNFKVQGALAASNNRLTGLSWWHGVLTGMATFDMFELAASVEASRSSAYANNDIGVGGSVGFKVTDDVVIRLGGRYYDSGIVAGNADAMGEVAGEIAAAVTETVTLTGRIGGYIDVAGAPGFFGAPGGTIGYARGTVAWAPGGGFKTAGSLEVQSTGGWRADFSASKSFN